MNEQSQTNKNVAKCLICGGSTFLKEQVLLNEKWSSAFNLEAGAKEGVAYICENCGFKHEFYLDKQR
jgi:predicted nucleic-acid-binding Zn-ribbon protein